MTIFFNFQRIISNKIRTIFVMQIVFFVNIHKIASSENMLYIKDF